MQNFRLSTAHVKFQFYILTGSFCWKYIKFQLKKYRGIISHDTEERCKIWRKTDLLKKWQEFGEFWPKHSKVSKISTLIGFFCWKYIMLDLEKYKGVMRNLANFHQRTWKCQNWDFDRILLYKTEYPWAKNLQRIYVYWLKNMIQNLKRNWLVASKLTWGIWRILTRALETLKNLHFNGLFVTKLYNIWAKKVQWTYLSWYWRLMQIWNKNWLVV